MRTQLFWSLAILVAFLLPLIVGAFCIERLAPSRKWLKRLRGLEAGRRAMAEDLQ
jgi:hypothetical protein